MFKRKHTHLYFGWFVALIWAAPSAAQTEFAMFPGTDISYTITTEIDTRNPADVPQGVLGNAYLKVRVTLKNNVNERRKLILCLYGKSDRQANNLTSPVRGVELLYDANAKQFTCAPAANTQTKRQRFGNMGCQPVTLDPMGQTEMVFVTGSSPVTLPDLALQITGGKVVQDGNRRDINGAGLLPGHRMTTSQNTFQRQSLYSILDQWILQLLVLKDEAIDLGCMKAADVAVKPGEQAYNPPCATPVDFAKACNKCFGMNTYISRVEPPNMVMRSMSTRDVSATVPQPGKKVGLSLPADPGGTGVRPNSVLTLLYIPGQGQPPGVLQECDPIQEGCFQTAPLANESFPFPEDGPTDYGTLTIHFPAAVPSAFAADFFATLSDLSTGDVLVQNWVRVRSPLACDINEDARVDRMDIDMIFRAIGTLADSDSTLDADKSGAVTVNDARICTAQCAKPNCVP